MNNVFKIFARSKNLSNKKYWSVIGGDFPLHSGSQNQDTILESLLEFDFFCLCSCLVDSFLTGSLNDDIVLEAKLQVHVVTKMKM